MDTDFDAEQATDGMDKLRHGHSYEYIYWLDTAGTAPVAEKKKSKVTEQELQENESDCRDNYRSRPLRPGFAGCEIRQLWTAAGTLCSTSVAPGQSEALAGSVWLDLYAGTGGLGLKRQPRGGELVHFVESLGEAADLIARDLKSLGITRGFQLLKGHSSEGGSCNWTQSGATADFVFLDPPVPDAG